MKKVKFVLVVGSVAIALLFASYELAFTSYKARVWVMVVGLVLFVLSVKAKPLIDVQVQRDLDLTHLTQRTASKLLNKIAVVIFYSSAFAVGSGMLSLLLTQSK